MDKDVQSKLQKLCNQYLYAQSQLELLRPQKLLSTKQQRKAQMKATEVVGGLRDARRPVAAALVRLAYVRAMREVSPNARLGPAQKVELQRLTKQLGNALQYQEAQSLRNLRHHIRKLRLAEQLEDWGYPEPTMAIIQRGVPTFPLEQRARECALSIVQTAAAAGAQAGTGYDDAQNAA
jgi:hypothetical protein